jgi:chaperonin GroES
MKKSKKKGKKPAAKKVAVKKASAKAALSPLGDRVLLKPLPPETMTSFGIIIPDTAKEKPEQGTVVAVGPKSSLKVGQKVVFSKKDYDEDLFKEVKVGGVEHYIISESNILGILN